MQLFFIWACFNVDNEHIESKYLFFFVTGADDVLKFQGNDSTIDHFRLILRVGDSLLVGGR